MVLSGLMTLTTITGLCCCCYYRIICHSPDNNMAGTVYTRKTYSHSATSRTGTRLPSRTGTRLPHVDRGIGEMNPLLKSEKDDTHYGSTMQRHLIHSDILNHHFMISTAKERGQVPFLDHQMLEVDCAGREYTNVDHDITLRISEGAVAEGEKIHFEVGVTMYGPFIFPENTQPISPILWLHKLDENIKLNKPFELVLPHCYAGSVTPPDQISFAVAFSNDITKDSNDEPQCLLQLWETDTNFYTDQMYGAIQTSSYRHQIFCIVRHKSIGHWCKDISFSLARVDLRFQPSQTVQEFHFYGLFDLATHRKELEKKLRRQGQTVTSLTSFKFNTANYGSQPSIKLTSSKMDKMVLKPAVREIRANDITSNFKKFDPPKIRIQPGAGTFPIKFIGCSIDSNLEYQLPLPEASIQVDHDCLQEESNSNLQQCEEITTPQLSDAIGTNVVTKLSANTHYDLSMEMRHGEVHQTTYFHTAKNTANVPFLDHQMLECDCAGREYTNVDHDITLRIPEGAVAEGEKIHFEVGVAMYGPFIFPENTQPISPILWLCVLEEDAQLRKPFQIVLPHYLTGLSKEKIEQHQVRFAKANHSDYTFIDTQISYKFHQCVTKPLLASTGYRNYGVLASKHCCFYYLTARKSPEVAFNAGYCLIRIESCISPQRNEFYFAGIYFLETCLRSLKEQFPRKEGYRISRHDRFKFKHDPEPYIQVAIPAKNDQSLVTVGFEPLHAKITLSDITSFWNENFENMKLKHETHMYPPRVKMTVCMNNPNQFITLPVKFLGCEDDNKLDLDVELTLPLGLLPSSPTSESSFSGLHNSEPRSQAVICGRPKLKDAFKKLLPLATYWKTLGILLGVSNPVLNKIKSDEEGANDRLQEMLSEWLRQIDPPPSWTALADAVEEVDSSKAVEIRKHCLDMPIN